MMKKIHFLILSALCLALVLAMPVMAIAALKGSCGLKPVAASSGQAAAPAAAAPSAAPVQKVIRPLERAMNFELEAVVGDEIKTITLEDYKGKWRVVCFYPADFTFVWPTELAAVAGKYEELKALNVEVIAISTDTVFSHWMWKKTSPTVKNVKYPMASDPNGEVSRAYGVYQEESGLNHRGRFIIDPDGIVRAVEIIYPPVGRSVEELIRQIKAMQTVDANPGMAAPAGWKPGGQFIHTGKDYIGVY